MIDAHNEALLQLREIGANLPRPASVPAPHRITVQRWISRGIRGVKLETVRIGGSVYTSREALARFIERTNSVAIAAEPGFDIRQQAGGAR